MFGHFPPATRLARPAEMHTTGQSEVSTNVSWEVRGVNDSAVNRRGPIVARHWGHGQDWRAALLASAHIAVAER